MVPLIVAGMRLTLRVFLLVDRPPLRIGPGGIFPIDTVPGVPGIYLCCLKIFE